MDFYGSRKRDIPGCCFILGAKINLRQGPFYIERPIDIGGTDDIENKVDKAAGD